jgi:hypothetical protein
MYVRAADIENSCEDQLKYLPVDHQCPEKWCQQLSYVILRLDASRVSLSSYGNEDYDSNNEVRVTAR